MCVLADVHRYTSSSLLEHSNRPADRPPLIPPCTKLNKTKQGKSSVVSMSGASRSSSAFDGLPKNPFGQLGLHLTDSDLRETAYEILVAACRSSGSSRPLTFVSNSEGRRTAERSLSISPSLQRSVASSAASKVKKALGLKSKKKSDSVDGGQVHKKKASTVGELIRTQMRISEQIDSRVRRALLRIAAGQLGKRVEMMVLPLELLQQLKSSDFSSQAEYEAWQKRIVKILEIGLLVHPYIPLDRTDKATRQLKEIIHGAYGKPIDTGKHSESMKALRNVVTSLACRSFDGSVSEVHHWADGYPLNLSIYQALLESCFDVNEETSIIEEVDEVLELVKKTWTILGVNQNLHNLCFAWVLFYQYVATGQVEADLLSATQKLLLEFENEIITTDDSAASWSMMRSALGLILDWAENRLVAYHEFFYRGNIEVMQYVLTLGISAAKMLEPDSQEYYQNRNDDVACNKTDSYIRLSLQRAYLQEKEMLISSRKSAKSQQTSVPMLSTLAQNITDLAFNEKEIYSPVLKQWHPMATGVAAATLHACYGNELKHFISSISELNPSAVQVLIASDKLEKDLVQMAVADSADSDDGGKRLIQEMTPYESEAVIGKLVKAWIKTRVDRLKEWVQRNVHQEVWDPRANKEQFAPSAVEALRMMDETLEAFFLLPIPMHNILIPELMAGLDKSLQNYVLEARSSCGIKNNFVPALPALTRCSAGSKFGVFKKKDRLNMVSPKKSKVSTAERESAFYTPQLCIRINTMHLIRKELEVLGKRITSNLSNSGYSHESSGVSGKMFELSASACVESIQQLSELTGFKIIFRDLSHVLWEHLYVGEVSVSRIEPFLQELEQNLEIVSATVHDRVRTRVITDIMRASFEGFMLVLLAGGPSRCFTPQDAAIIDEDFKFLVDLFWSDGDGLPIDLINKFSSNIKEILRLFHIDTENLIGQFKRVTLAKLDAATDRSHLPLPPTSGKWSPTDPNTLLRILCHRNDELASKFLKKTYNLPTKLS